MLTLLACSAVLVVQDPETVDHAMRVRLVPDAHRIEVVDDVLVPLGSRESVLGAGLRFRLHAGLGVPAVADGFTVEPIGGPGVGEAGVGEHGRAPIREFALRRRSVDPWPLDGRVRLTYAGVIDHPLVDEEQEYARSFARSPGLIDERGVVLSGSSFFVPDFGGVLVTFRMQVELPDGWLAVSQGERVEHGPGRVTWSCPQPMDEVYLIAARWSEYERAAGAGVTAFAFLRDPDPNLAAKYLEVTAQYLELYRRLIGPYPYAKFALVENFWETGYGMPSFTLLGPAVIRLPFILHSSYPHEILHNWWGNSVFVDAARGNWCEGLTAYLADHLVAEGQGRGVDYRRDTLKRYRDYVRSGQDFPLTEFRSRHSSATEAVGYGKALMTFHMLRRELGDDVFTRGLREFYRQQRFRRAAWADVEAAFTGVAGRDLAPFFAQWVERTGAPELALELGGANVGTDGRISLRLTLRQLQQGAPYRLRVPVAIDIWGGAVAQVEALDLVEREAEFTIALDGAPRRVSVDPMFDLFRSLHRSEIPPSVGQLFGAPRVTLVLPGAGDPLADAWRGLAVSWSGSEQADVEIVDEAALGALPDDRAVWVLGSENRWAAAVRDGVARYRASVGDSAVDFGAVQVARQDHCFVLTAPHPADPDLAIAWIGADRGAALPGLARKLPHYGKYSFLAFAGDEPSNDAKGQWAVTDSPLTRSLSTAGGAAASSALPAREPLARLAPVFDAARLREDVAWLAADGREGRGVGTAGLAAAGEWIAARFAALGLEPGGDDGTFLQRFREPGGPDGTPALLHNIVAVLPGTNPDFAGQSVVVGAHYDHLGRGWPDVRADAVGQIHNGADDNASGVAVMLEVARVLAEQLRPERSVVFVAFSGEEWGRKGSQYYVRAMRDHPVTGVIAMLNLDTVGRLGDGAIQLLGTGTATEWPHIARGIGFTTGVRSDAVHEDPGGSDQQSFVACGVPAVQVFAAGGLADYHRPTDDVDKIDAGGMVAVATFVREAVVYLSERPEPLTATIPGVAAPAGGAVAAPVAARRASLGTLPDFAFAGPGVRVDQVTAGSAAAAAGIQPGDLLISIDGVEIADLRGYADLLRAREPGAVVRIRLRRGAGGAAVESDVEATLTAR